MEVTQKFYTNIKEIIDKYNSKSTYELEAKYKGKIDRDIFYKTLQYFMSINKNYTEQIEVLDISIKNSGVVYRISVEGKDKVSEYCKTNLLPADIIVMKKTRDQDNRIEYPEFNFNIDLSSEEIITDYLTITETVHSMKKGFRYKKRYSFEEDDKLRYDLTIVKSSKTIGGEYIAHDNFASSGLTTSKEIYEIELEVIKKVDAKLFISSMIQLYSIINDEMDVITEAEKENVLISYLESYHSDKLKPSILHKKKLISEAKEKPQDYFVGPQPITLELKNLLEPGLGVTTILQDYTVTEKADGERYNMYINNQGKCYLINNRLTIKYMGMQLESIKNTLFDGEYITKDILGNAVSIYAIFDVYYYNNKSVYGLPLIKDRYDIIKSFSEKYGTKFENYQIIAKEFLYGDSILTEAKKILEKESSYDYKIDGLIFTPKDLNVGGLYKSDPGNLYGTWPLTFKWKSPKDNTIDFLVRYQKGDKGDKIIFKNSKGHKILNLYVGYNPVQWEDITARKYLEGNIRQVKEYKEQLFKPGDTPDTFAQCYVDTSKKEFNGRGICESGEEIEDDTIVEFRYENGWIPVKNRKDKSEKYKSSGNLTRTANDYGSALNVWRSITNPITQEIISGDIKLDPKNIIVDDDQYYYRAIPRDKMASLNMLEFHNYWVKTQLIKSVGGKESLMDIACGQAGDLNKWREGEFKKIFGIDYNRNNIVNPRSGAYARLYQAKTKDHSFAQVKHVFLTMDGGKRISPSEIENEDDKYIAQILWGLTKSVPDVLKPYENYVTQGFDVISCQFALHYFFESEEKLSNFTYNIDKFLKPGGYFIGTCLDGKKIKDQLRSKKKGTHITGKQNERILWDICKVFDNKSAEIDYGEEIDVYMESIGKVTREYLVNFTNLSDKLLQYNIKPATEDDLKDFVIKEPFVNFKEVYNYAVTTEETRKNAKYKQSVNNMTDDEKNYSFLNTYFVYVKQQGVKEGPRILKKKIIVKQST
jgi:hypothetical protein